MRIPNNLYRYFLLQKIKYDFPHIGCAAFNNPSKEQSWWSGSSGRAPPVYQRTERGKRKQSLYSEELGQIPHCQ
jgi:hypothetical protein